MRITVNGTQQDFPDALTVETLLDRMGLAEKPCAVEVNRAVVRKGEHATHALTDGDAVELVTLVGGG